MRAHLKHIFSRDTSQFRLAQEATIPAGVYPRPRSRAGTGSDVSSVYSEEERRSDQMKLAVSLRVGGAVLPPPRCTIVAVHKAQLPRCALRDKNIPRNAA